MMCKDRKFSAITQEYPSLFLPPLSQAWAELGNAMLKADLAFAVHVGGEIWQWRALPSATTQGGAGAVRFWACTVHLSVGGESLVCWLDSLLPLAAAPLSVEDLDILPPALAAAALHSTVAPLLDALGEYLGQRCTLDAYHCQQEEALALEEGLRFELTRNTEEGPQRVRALLVGEISHPLFTAMLDEARQSAVARPLPALVLSCPVLWHTRPLFLRHIRALEVGDVLLMPASPGDAECSVAVQVAMGDARSARYFRACWNAERQTVMLEKSMQQDAEQIMKDVEIADSLEDCTLPVRCCLGHVSLSLADIAALAPGTVLGPLDSTEAPVTLHVGNTLIGRGALVDIEGRVGVRVTKVSLPTARSPACAPDSHDGEDL